MSTINANLLSSKITDAANKASAGMSVDSSFFDDTLQAANSYIDSIKNSLLGGTSSDSSEAEKDPGDISNITDIYEAMYKKVNVFLHSMLTAQGAAYTFTKKYKRYKMEFDPDSTLLKELIQEKVRMVLPDDFI